MVVASPKKWVSEIGLMSTKFGTIYYFWDNIVRFGNFWDTNVPTRKKFFWDKGCQKKFETIPTTDWDNNYTPGTNILAKKSLPSPLIINVEVIICIWKNAADLS